MQKFLSASNLIHFGELATVVNMDELPVFTRFKLLVVFRISSNSCPCLGKLHGRNENKRGDISGELGGSFGGSQKHLSVSNGGCVRGTFFPFNN